MKKVFFSWRGGADIYNYANEGGRRGGVGYPLWVNGWVPYLGPYEEGGSQTEGILLSFLSNVDVLHDSVPDLPGHGQVVRPLIKQNHQGHSRSRTFRVIHKEESGQCL